MSFVLKINITLCMLGNFFMLFCCLLTFIKINFLKNSLRNTVKVSNGLNPDQDQHFVGPDLGPICLQRLSAEEKVDAIKERVNCNNCWHFK